MGLLHLQSEHYTGGDVDEVQLQYLAYKRERARCTQVAFDDLYVVVFSEELDIERARYVEGLCNLLAYFLDAPYGLYVEFLGRELYCGVA